MKQNVFIFSFIILTISIMSCQNNSTKQKEIELKERELELREKELEQKEKISSSIKVSKFVYVIFKVKEPKLIHIEAYNSYLPGIQGFSEPVSTNLPERNSVIYNDYVYSSEVTEIQEFDEDKQYEYMDMIEAKLRQQIKHANMQFELEVISKVTDWSEQQRLKEEKAKIVDRKLNVFGSYKEASIHRKDNEGKY